MAEQQKEGRILLVDDEMDLLEVFKLELEANDFEVFTASNGLEALEMFEKHYYDVIITDICMPWMNGADLLKKLRQIAATRKTYVFAISGHTLYSEKELKEWGASALIPKPFNFEQVIETIKAHVQMIRAVELAEKAG